MKLCVVVVVVLFVVSLAGCSLVVRGRVGGDVCVGNASVFACKEQK